jgi:hypothetical protein
MVGFSFIEASPKCWVWLIENVDSGFYDAGVTSAQ